MGATKLSPIRFEFELPTEVKLSLRYIPFLSFKSAPRYEFWLYSLYSVFLTPIGDEDVKEGFKLLSDFSVNKSFMCDPGVGIHEQAGCMQTLLPSQAFNQILQFK